MLDKKEIKIIYTDWLLSEEPSLSEDDITLLYLQYFLPKDKSIRILDAGCGNGKYALKLANEGYFNIDAVDLFETIKADKYRYQQASIDDLPFDDTSFDFVYCNSVIFYLPDIEKGFKEFNRVLKKGGTFFMTAHTRYSLFTLWRIIKRFIKPDSVPHLKGVHFYTAATYASCLEQNGFEVLWVDGYELLIFFSRAYKEWVRILKHYLGLKLPYSKNRITRTKFFAEIKSIFGYHSILVAKKIRNI